MKSLFWTLAFSMVLSAAYPQVGITGSYTAGNYRELQTQLANHLDLGVAQGQDLWQNGYKLGIDYWFRLKPVRIEFFPEIAWSQFQTDLFDPIQSTPLNSKLQNLHFQANINIYPLDFVGDCDCPTFSKSEPIFQRGFFIQLSPGVQYQSMVFDAGASAVTYSDWNYTLAGGIGLDIGVSDFITVTPYAKYWYLLEVNHDQLNEFMPYDSSPTGEFENSSASMIEAGLRLGLRFDQ